MTAMISRRLVVLEAGSSALVVLLPRNTRAQPPAPPEGKGAFIEKAMAQVREEIKSQAAEEAKHGEFSSIAPPPNIVPFGDWDYYYLKDGNLVWSPNAGQTFKKVFVPIGFVTDLTSVPRVIWSALRPEGRYAYAAVIHDFLYWTQDRPREEADEILRIAMQDSKVRADIVFDIFHAVRVGGGSAWQENKRLKAAGEKRLLKKFPADFTTSWADWKKEPGVFAD